MSVKDCVLHDDIMKDYILSIDDYRTYPSDEELFSLYHEGDDKAREKARELIAKKYRAYILKLARKYLGNNIPLEDLVQEGNIALLEAIDTYDETKGHFMPYLKWAVNSNIKSLVYKNYSNHHVPEYLVLIKIRVQIFSTDYYAKYGVEPSIDELSSSLGISKSRLNSLSLLKDTISLDTAYSDDDSRTLLDITSISDDTESQIILRETIKSIIEKSNLTDKEKRALYMYFGIGKSGKAYSLPEIGRKLGFTKQNAGSLKDRALQSLYYMPEIQALGRDLGYKCKKRKQETSLKSDFPITQKKVKAKQEDISTFYNDLLKEGYTAESIDTAISKLSPAKIKVLYRRCGNDLENPVSVPYMRAGEKRNFTLALRLIRENLERDNEEENKLTLRG